MAVARDNYDPYAIDPAQQGPGQLQPNAGNSNGVYTPPAAPKTATPNYSSPDIAHPLAGWGSVQQFNNGNNMALASAWSDWAQGPGGYGGGGGFTNGVDPGGLQAAVNRFNLATGLHATAQGDRIVGPNGFSFDAVRASHTPGQSQYWAGDFQGPGATQYLGGNTPPPGAGGVGGGGGYGGGSFSFSSGGLNGHQDIDPQLRTQLLALMNRSQPGPIDPLTDPNLAPQAQAYAAARQNAAQQERAALAERSAAEGLNTGGQGSGAFDTGVQGIQEQAGRDIAGQQAGLVGQEVAARRNDLQNALGLANSIGARDSAQKIQMQLAQLDNQYRYAALAQNQGQFNDQYGLNRLQIQNDSNRNALLAALGG